MSLNYSRLICCCTLFCLCLPLYAQPTARLEADSLQMETGNPFVLHLSVPAVNKPDTLGFGPWLDFFRPVNLLTPPQWTKTGGRFTCDLRLIFFDADTLFLPPLSITFAHADTVFTNSLSLIIYPTPGSEDLNDMAPIKDIEREPVLWTDYLPWAITVLVALLILGLLFWWYRRGNKKSARSRKVELLPHELALKKLGVLRQNALWRQGEVKAHCAELTFIIREYLEKRYKVPALESTSSEWLMELQSKDFPNDLYADLENILIQADMVKFAKAIPPEHFYLYSADFAQAMVSRTIPAPAVEDTALTPKRP